MNVRMWHHAATQRNIATLTQDGIHFIGPNPGEMACGEFGLGRMAEPAEIVSAIEKLLNSDARPLSGKHVLITAGPTREPIDPVRFISNHSSGKQGYALAEQAEHMGAKVTLVSGPVSLTPPPGVTVVNVETADQMLAACETAAADLVICAAAVADWKVSNPATQKLKKNDKAEAPQLAFTANPDILKTLSAKKSGRAKLVVGFAAETENVVANALEKFKRKGCDLIVANDVSEGVFGTDKNAVHIITQDGVEDWPQTSKDDVACRILEFCARRLT